MRKILTELMAFNEAVDSTVPFASMAEQQSLTNLTPSAGHQKASWFIQLKNLSQADLTLVFCYWCIHADHLNINLIGSAIISCQGGVAKDQGTEMGTFSSELGTAAKSTEQLGSPERDRGQTVHITGLCRICSGQEATELAKPTSE